MVHPVCLCLEGRGDIGDAVGAFCYGVGVSDQQSVEDKDLLEFGLNANTLVFIKSDMLFSTRIISAIVFISFAFILAISILSGIFKSLSIFINGSEIMRVENSISDFINTSVLAFKPNSRRSLSSTAFAK